MSNAKVCFFDKLLGAVVILFIIGIALIALGGWKYQQGRVPDGGQRIQATVTKELTQKPKRGGEQRLFYGPEAEYNDPRTGERTLYTPIEYNRDRYESGQQIDLIFDPVKGQVRHVSPAPIRDVAIPIALGVACIVLGFFAI